MTNTDPQGYGELRSILGEIERALRAQGQLDLARLMVETQGYYGHNGSEFIGESKLALVRVVRARVLDKPTQALAKNTIKRIDEGTRSIGSVPIPTQLSDLWPAFKDVIRTIWKHR